MASGNSAAEWAKAKTDLAGRLGQTPVGVHWDFLVKTGAAGGYARGEMKLQELERQYLFMESHYDDYARPSRAARSGGAAAKSSPTDHRASALAGVLARLAERLPEVQAFRRDVLGGELVDWRQVAGWIRTREPADGGPQTQSFTVRGDLPAFGLSATEGAGDLAARWLDAAAAAVGRGDARVVLAGVAAETMRFYDLDDAGGELWASVTRIDPATDLWRLREVARAVEKLYGWSEPWAVHFVLSGLAPPLVTLSVTQELGPWGARISARADPRVSPGEVAAAYKRVRAKYRTGPNQPMAQKHAEMALFLAAYYETGTRPWKELREHWNTEHPEWTVTDDSRFIRDATAAWERVTARRFAFVDTTEDKGETP